MKIELSERHFSKKKTSKVDNTANGGLSFTQQQNFVLYMEQACLSTDNDYPINIGKS